MRETSLVVLRDEVPKGIEQLHNLQVRNTHTYHMGITLTYRYLSARKHRNWWGRTKQLNLASFSAPRLQTEACTDCRLLLAASSHNALLIQTSLFGGAFRNTGFSSHCGCVK